MLFDFHRRYALPARCARLALLPVDGKRHHYPGLVMVGNFEVDVEHQQQMSHLFGPVPREIRDDTAFMDRIRAYHPRSEQAESWLRAVKNEGLTCDC